MLLDEPDYRLQLVLARRRLNLALPYHDDELPGVITFDPAEHPRDPRGQFRKTLNSLNDMESVEFPDGNFLRREGRSFYVGGPNRSEQRFGAARIADAEETALLYTASSTHEKSLGGKKRFHDVDSALAAHAKAAPHKPPEQQKVKPGKPAKTATTTVPKVKATGTGGSASELSELGEHLRGGKPAVRVPPEALPGIFAHGGFKSLHTGEVGTRGMASKDQRATLERKIWEIPEDAKPEDYPIYGYVSHDDDPVGGDDDVSLGGYGATRMTLRSSVAKRATVTVGDSLMAPDAVPSPWASPTKESAAGMGGVGVAQGGNYVEAQIFGGIRLSDVESIHYGASEPTEAQKATMKKLGIKWTVDRNWKKNAERIDEWGY